MNKHYRNFNKYFLISLLILMLVISIFNAFIDPFSVFSKKTYFFNNIKSDLKRQERLTKFFDLDRHHDYEILITGTSRADFSIPPDYFTQVSGKKVINLAMQGTNFSEQKYIIDRAIKTQPNLKTVIWAIDFDFFYNLTENDISDIKNLNKNIITKYSAILLSQDALSASFMTLIKNLNPNYQTGFLSNGMRRIFINNNIEQSFEKTIHQYKNTGIDFKNKKPNIELFETYIKYLNSKGVNVIIYMQPVHSTMLEIINQNQAWNTVGEFKKALANIQPFYDFYYPSEYSNEEIKSDMQYFFEPSHCTYIIGEKIIDEIVLNKNKFGYLVSPDNVDKLNVVHSQKLKEWESDNPEWINKIKTIRQEER